MRTTFLNWLTKTLVLLCLFMIAVLAPQGANLAQDVPTNITVDIELTSVAQGGDPVSGNPVLASGNDVFTVITELTGGECPQVIRNVPVDVVLVIDVSGSMEDFTSDGVSKLEAAKQAAIRFLDRFTLTPGEPLTSDQIAVVVFDFSAYLISDLTSDIDALRAGINSIGSGSGTSINVGIDAATDILASPSANFEGNAVGTIIVMSDGKSDVGSMMRAAERARTTAGARIVTVGLGDETQIDRQALTNLADTPSDAYFTTSAAELAQFYDDIATRITPRTAANNLSITYTLNAGDFEIIPGSQRPTSGVMTPPNQVTWTLSTLFSANSETFEFDVRALRVGSYEVGRVEISYLPCLETTITNDSEGGPSVTIIAPTATPTPTNTPTPTFTPTPSITPTATPASPLRTAELSPIMNQGVTSAFCPEGWWDWIPWVLALIALIIALYLAWRAWRELGPQPQFRDILCWLARLLFYLSFVPILFLLARPFIGQVCDLPESVYFWRQEGDQAGIYLTHDGLRSDQPAQLEFVNAQGCTGCHNVPAQADQITSIIGPAPNRVSAFSLNGEGVPIPNVEAVYAALSPDGSRLAYSTRDADLFVMTVATGQTSQLTNASDLNFGALMPAWSPDGDTLAYVRAERLNINRGLSVTGTSDLYLVSASNNNAAQPVNGASANGRLNYYPAFAPDGQWLAFTSNPNTMGSTYNDNGADVWLTNLATGIFKPIEGNAAGASDSWAAWNREGTRLAFNSNRTDTDYDVLIVEILSQQNGTTSTVPLQLIGASSIGVIEHMPAWGPLLIRPDLMDELGGLLPLLLIPLILGLLAWLCLRSHRQREVTDGIDIGATPPLREAAAEKLPPAEFQPLWQPRASLVVGLGRSGWHVAAQLKKTLYDAALGQPMDKVRFLTIIADTQQRLITQQFSGMMMNDSELVRWQDNLQNLVEGARNEQDLGLRSWVDARYLTRLGDAAFDPRSGLQDQRVLGRAALVNNLRGNYSNTKVNIYESLRTAAQDVLKASTSGNTLDIIIVTDLSDDVGGSIFNDLAYLTRRLKADLKIDTIRIVGHALTDTATNISGTVSATRRVNVAATLRELERFQLGNGAPFSVQYGASEGSTPFDGMVDRMLFDELYVHDGRGQNGAVTRVAPEVGMYPAVADIIAVWLDEKAAEGFMDEWRNAQVGKTNTDQIRERKLMVGGVGIREYRLPFADLLNDLSVRFARALLQQLLMGASTELPRLDARLATEPVGARNTVKPEEIAAEFLAENLGSYNQLSDHWRGFFKGAINLSRPTNLEAEEADRLYRNSVKELAKPDSVTEDDDEAWREWLQRTVQVLLNGEQRPGTAEDPIRLREAKISRAYAFLNALAAPNGLLSQLSAKLSQEKLKSDKADLTTEGEQIRRFIKITADLGASLLQVGQVLGIDTPKKSVYQQLALRERAIESQWASQRELATRTYVTKNENGEPLRDLWYKTYLIDQGKIKDGMRQFLWRVDWVEDRWQPTLLLLLNDRQVVLDLNNPALFEEALIELGRYFLAQQEIDKKESLVKILRADLLREDNQQKTADALVQGSRPLLGFDVAVAGRAQRKLILSAHRGIEEANRLRERMRYSQDGYEPEQILRMESSNPFSLTLVQTAHSIAVDGIRSLTDARDDYRRETGITGDVYDPQASLRTPIFEAEAASLMFERRLRAIGQQGRLFQPVVTTGLANRRKAEAYLLATAAGQFIVSDTTRGLILETPLLTTTLILVPLDAPAGFGVLMDGLLAFNRLVDEQTADRLAARHRKDPALMEALEEWYDTDGQRWRRFNDATNRQINADLNSITRMLIIDLLEIEE